MVVLKSIPCCGGVASSVVSIATVATVMGLLVVVSVGDGADMRLHAGATSTAALTLRLQPPGVYAMASSLASLASVVTATSGAPRAAGATSRSNGSSRVCTFCSENYVEVEH